MLLQALPSAKGGPHTGHDLGGAVPHSRAWEKPLTPKTSVIACFRAVSIRVGTKERSCLQKLDLVTYL